jgi:hypothetical protein
MALTYLIDRARGIVRSRGVGVITTRELQDFYSRLLTDRWFDSKYRSLGDLREVTEVAVDAFGLAEAAAVPVFAEGTRCALVATGDAVYGMARAYASYNERMGRTIRVFRAMDLAEAWLDEPPGNQRPTMAQEGAE